MVLCSKNLDMHFDANLDVKIKMKYAMLTPASGLNKITICFRILYSPPFSTTGGQQTNANHNDHLSVISWRVRGSPWIFQPHSTAVNTQMLCVEAYQSQFRMIFPKNLQDVIGHIL